MKMKKNSNKLQRILIDFHRSQISTYEELVQETISQVSHIIIPEFVANIPTIGDQIEQSIEDLLADTSRMTKKSKK